VNKFKALEMFQSWPPEWQRLCAECWIETGEVEPSIPCDVEARFCNRDLVSIPFDRPKAAKVAKRPARDGMRYSRDEVSEVDSHLSESRSCYEAAKIMDKKYPSQRTKHAWRRLAERIRSMGFVAMMDRAVDVEFK